MIKSFLPARLQNLFSRPDLLNSDKLDLINRCTFSSFADLGGVWRVEGGYTFHALRRPGVRRGILVDTHFTDTVRNEAKNFPQLELINGNFGDSIVAKQIDVDALFLFDVLLHQVKPDWDEILKMYSSRTSSFVIFNQQYTRDHTVRLLELGKDEYFKSVPHSAYEEPYSTLFDKLDEEHPQHGRKWRDVHHIWQWGITDADLEAKLADLGFRQTYYRNCGRFGDLENFENHAFIFERSS